MSDNTAVALRPSGHLQIDPGQEFWTPEQVAALGVLGIRGATNGDLAVFFHYCQKTRLDPFSRQIYYIKRRENVNGQMADKWTIQVGIDGFRVIRDRIAAEAGVTVDFEDTVWFDAEGTGHAVWLSAEPPAACRVVLVKHLADGFTLRYPAVLRTAAYMATKDGKPVSQWKTQADHMIEKCCEAFATRRAFPHDLGGLYIDDETANREQPPPVRKVTAAEIIEPESPPQRPRTHRPGKTELANKDRLERLMKQIPLSPPETAERDWADVLCWLAQAGPWEGTAEQVAVVLPLLEEHLQRNGGDPEEAVKQLWLSYEAAQEDAVPGD